MLDPKEILVFSQTQNQKVLVGKLSRKNQKYYFEYDPAYQRKKNSLPLGPEFDLWKSKFVSPKLFPSIADRIPSRQNPAYADYCREWNVDVNENDVFVLLTTIGRRGPSTFVFEPAHQNVYNGENVRSFRKRLGLNHAEFENLIGISHATLVKLETSRSKNVFYLSQIRLIDEVPAALKWLIEQRGQILHDQKRLKILSSLTKSS